jgi:uncharacterized membrane protein YfcA
MYFMLLTIALGGSIGLILALTGAGGGIFAIPLLVFGLHLPVQHAAPVGLFAVGLAAAIGAALGLRQKIVRYRAAALIGFAGMLTAPLGVTLAQWLPNRPLTAAFALVLGYTAWKTLRRTPNDEIVNSNAPCRVESGDFRLTWTLPCARALAGTGMLSGLMSGLFGVGGGFVIIPALSRHTNLEFRSIQATSLAVIALVSLSGVSATAWHGTFKWDVALPFAGGAVLALLLGNSLAALLNQKILQGIFAWITVLVTLLMLARAFNLFSS